MNKLVLAVAGGRKTQSIVDHCVEAPRGRRILVLTYTQFNQRQLETRLAQHRPLDATVHVQGWFSFLLNHWVRPYLPVVFAGRRLRGFNFEGDPGRFRTGEGRFLDADGRAYKLHLSHLAYDINLASNGAVLDRLAQIYDEVHIDEIQDLNGYDLEILLQLMDSPIDLHMVGDIRQALIHTNVQDPKNKQYKGVDIKDWFDAQASRGLIEIEQSHETWRCCQPIADFADSIFDETWGFPATTSQNQDTSGHDGMFAVAPEHAKAYLATYSPLCLRHSASSAKHLDLPFINIGVSKGMSVDHVLIGPTANVVSFIRGRGSLAAGASCSLYVAVTRARFSVAIVAEDPASTGLRVWAPED